MILIKIYLCGLIMAAVAGFIIGGNIVFQEGFSLKKLAKFIFVWIILAAIFWPCLLWPAFKLISEDEEDESDIFN